MNTPFTVLLLQWVDGGRDERNNQINAYGAPVDVPAYGWEEAGRIGLMEENNVNRSETMRQLNVYVPPPPVPVTPKDLLVVDGLTYQVLGYPEDFTHGPFGAAGGFRIRVYRAEG